MAAFAMRLGNAWHRADAYFVNGGSGCACRRNPALFLKDFVF